MRKGFTLIELIVVISIIGLLTTLGVSSYRTSLRDSRDARRKEDLQNFLKAIEWFQIRNGRGPTEVGYCQSSIGNDPGICPPATPTYQWEHNATWTDLVTGGYISEFPVDPINNIPYYYYYEPYNPGETTYTGWVCPSTAGTGNCGGWVRALLESTGSYYYVYWNAP